MRPEPQMSLRVFSEWLPSLGVCAMYLWPLDAPELMPLTAARAAVTLRVTSAAVGSLTLIWSHATAGDTVLTQMTVPWEAALPVTRVPERVQWQVDLTAAAVHLRLHYTAQSTPLPALPDESVRPWQVGALACRVCAAPLRDASMPFQRVAHLPSDTWHEWKDLWVCACTRHMLASSEMMRALPETQTGSFPARAGTLLVGTHHLLLHPSDLNAASYRVDHGVLYQEKKQRWERLLCARCLAPLGRTTPSDAPDITLEKHRISILSVDPAQNPAAVHTAETMLSSMMLQAVHAHAAYHFLIRDHVFMSPRLWMSVVAWNVSISLSLTEPPTRALSILFVDNEATAAHKASTTAHEVITLAEDHVSWIVHALQARHTMLPASRQQLGNLHCSFLRLLPHRTE